MNEIFLGIGMIGIGVTMLISMLVSLFHFVDMLADGHINIHRAILCVAIFALCVYGLSSIMGY